jgi:uncharacterized OB-fold protein
MSEVRPFTPSSYQKFVDEGKLMGNRCDKCGALYLPPRPLCPKCGSKNMEWKQLQGEGEIIAFTVIHVPPTQMTGKTPYTVGIVKLNKGPALTARISEEVKVGSKVVAEFKKEGEKTVLVFKPLLSTSP